MAMKQGPNVKRLIVTKMSNAVVLDGDGLAGCIEFLSNPEAIKRGAIAATKFVDDAIACIRQAAEPNPFKNATDEEIAGEILSRMKTPKGV